MVKSGAWMNFLLIAVAATSLAGSAAQPEDLTELCVACHSEKLDALQVSRHWPSHTQALESGYTGCQACHWPGSSHADDPGETIFSFTKEIVSEISGRCLTCHTQFDRHAAHQKAGLSCVDCHRSGHQEEVSLEPALLSSAEVQLCGDCHSEQRQQMWLPFRHRTSDGPLLCSDCHEPHAAASRNTLLRVDDERCFRCHAEKQGPFAFEHLAGTISGCASCHQPHGSTNPKLLVRHQIQALCLECHENTPVFHDLSRSRFQNCTLCHRAIHGSHVDPTLLR